MFTTKVVNHKIVESQLVRFFTEVSRVTADPAENLQPGFRGPSQVPDPGDPALEPSLRMTFALLQHCTFILVALASSVLARFLLY